MSDRLKAIVIGCGQIAGRFDARRPDKAILTHASAYHRHPKFEIVACVEPDIESRIEFSESWSVPASFATVDEFLQANISFDVASICVPTRYHAEVLEQLLETNVRAVFCEKPLTNDSSHAERLINSYKKHGILLAVNHLRRWDPSIWALRNELVAGEWGNIRSVIGYYNKGILNNGSHLIDLAQLMFGPLEMKAVTGAKIDYDPSDPTVDATLRWRNGVAMHLIGADARDMALFELHTITAHGIISIEESGFTIRRRYVRPSAHFAGYKQVGKGDWMETGLNTALYRAIENLHEALVDGTKLLSDGDSAFCAQVLCQEIQEKAVLMRLIA